MDPIVSFGKKRLLFGFDEPKKNNLKFEKGEQDQVGKSKPTFFIKLLPLIFIYAIYNNINSSRF
jgi:hypothetical protein